MKFTEKFSFFTRTVYAQMCFSAGDEKRTKKYSYVAVKNTVRNTFKENSLCGNGDRTKTALSVAVWNGGSGNYLILALE